MVAKTKSINIKDITYEYLEDIYCSFLIRTKGLT